MPLESTTTLDQVGNISTASKRVRTIFGLQKTDCRPSAGRASYAPSISADDPVETNQSFEHHQFRTPFASDDYSPTEIDLADYCPHGLILVSESFECIAANRAFLTLTQLTKPQLKVCGWLFALPNTEAEQLTNALSTTDWNKEVSFERECRLNTSIGRTIWIKLTARKVQRAELEPIQYVLTFEDIDVRKKQDEINRKLAYLDPLTGLANRRDFENALIESIVSDESYCSIIAVLFIDLDGFKEVNDTHGHKVGDQLLLSIANTIRSAGVHARKVARIGGDEFTVLLTDRHCIGEIKDFAQNLNALLLKNSHIKDTGFSVSASIGIAIHHRLDTDKGKTDQIVNDLLRHSDEAMYAAKQSGKNCYKFYGCYENEATKPGSLQRNNSLINDVQKAIENEHIYVQYQPQIDTLTNEIIAAEALLRWDHHNEGSISPLDFIPVLECSAAMGKLTSCLIKRICADIKTHFFVQGQQNDYEANHGLTNHDRTQADKGLSVAINLSANQLQNQATLETIDRVIRCNSLSPRQFIFEVTEATLLSHPHAATESIGWLRSKGYLVALDNFGRGYFSLATLHRFQLDRVNLDSSLIRDIEHDKASRLVVKGVVSLAHSLDLTVTAGGIESKAQLDNLKSIHCDRWQGFLKSPAIHPVEFVELINASAKSRSTIKPDLL